MTPEELKELQEKAALWDRLGYALSNHFVIKFPGSGTLQNTMNASSHVELLEEEIKKN